jgi:hypothetical protein
MLLEPWNLRLVFIQVVQGVFSLRPLLCRGDLLALAYGFVVLLLVTEGLAFPLVEIVSYGSAHGRACDLLEDQIQLGAFVDQETLVVQEQDLHGHFLLDSIVVMDGVSGKLTGVEQVSLIQILRVLPSAINELAQILVANNPCVMFDLHVIPYLIFV